MKLLSCTQNHKIPGCTMCYFQVVTQNSWAYNVLLWSCMFTVSSCKIPVHTICEVKCLYYSIFVLFLDIHIKGTQKYLISQCEMENQQELLSVKLSYTGEGLICSDNFIQHNVLGDGNCFFRAISYLLLGQEVKHDVIRAWIIDYIMDPSNFDKLRSYILQHYPSGEAYIQGEAMADLTIWVTEVELFACAQLCGKDIVCYSQSRWLRYPASGNSRKPTRSAFFIANKNGNHLHPVIGMQ